MKVILGLAATWGVPAKHGDILNANVKANKEEHLKIFLHIPRCMKIKDEKINDVVVSSAREVALELKQSLYGLNRQEDYGAICCVRDSKSQDLNSASVVLCL